MYKENTVLWTEMHMDCYVVDFSNNKTLITFNSHHVWMKCL